MCDEHEEEKVNIFCISCQKPTCSLCKVFGQHRDCNVSPMDKVYTNHKVGTYNKSQGLGSSLECIYPFLLDGIKQRYINARCRQ